MKFIHDEEKDYFLSQAQLYLNKLDESDLYYGNDEDCVRDYPSEESYNITCGVSKIVIIFNNKDWVIKIPFKGGIEDNSDCHRTTGQCPYTLASVVPCQDCPHHREEVDYNDYQGAVSNSIQTDEEWNYCALESKLWLAAEEESLGDVFLCTIQIGEYNGIPIYIQEKANTIGLYGVTQPSAELKGKYTNSFSDKSGFYDETFGAFLLEYYGESKLEKFFAFIEKYDISDFHRGNFGFQNNRPVFVDYSGFNG